MLERLSSVEAAMRDYFGADQRRIDHALGVTGFAEQILKHEKGDRLVVIAAALLHDIGIREAERKYGSSSGDLQEREGPPVAREILTGLAFDVAVIDEVCAIIASHHSPGEVDTDNFRVIWDADWLVNLGDEFDLKDDRKTFEMIRKIFQTTTGMSIAEQIYLQKDK
ncbi:MAG: HD domain-containing protein [Geobacteraceae bacterium]|nr:HD domain-containing protein [Geobacteraceae bacterium]